MSIRVVRLGSPRQRDEGVRLGTVRRPPRGVRKRRYSADDWFDVWLPSLAPSAALMAAARHPAANWRWETFARRYRAEMNRTDSKHLLETLAALSHHGNFSVGCYCEDERQCHRSILRQLLKQHGAKLAR